MTQHLARASAPRLGVESPFHCCCYAAIYMSASPLSRSVRTLFLASSAHPALVFAFLFSAYKYVQAKRKCRLLIDEVLRVTKLREQERTGRTAAERKLRQQVTAPTRGGYQQQEEASSSSQLSYRPIGKIASCFVERRGTPRQGLLVPAARAKLRVDASIVQPTPALEGLGGFSHVWLLYDFHENTNASKVAALEGGGARQPGKQQTGQKQSQKQAPRVEQVRAKVHPPGLSGGKIGLFATRTPHRPNPIGLTVARLLAVEGDTLVLGGADLIDGTPVLDVKPYLLHDVHSDASVPLWCEKRTDSSLIADVRFSEEADAALAAAVARRALRFYTDGQTLKAAIEQTLQLDIRTVHQGRGQAVDAAAGQQYSCRFDALTIDFTTYATHVLVTRIEAPKTKERPVAPTAVANARVAAELGMKPSSAL